jgi:Tol biopolymer transport system component
VSLVRAPALGGDTVTIYEDDPQSQGIGSGVAHFAMWSPDGERVALIAGTSQGLVTLMLDSQTGRRLEGVAIGSPVYLAWSPDSRFLAVHLQDLLFLYQLGQDGARGRRSVQLANIVGSYYAPQFAPGDNRIVYGDEVAGEGRLVLRMPDGLTTKDLGAGALNLAFGWSPDGETLAVMKGDSGWFDRLSIVAVSDGSGRDLLAKTMFGFWWSPDGRKIAVAAPSKSYQASVDWSVVDVATGHETPLGTLLPTPEFGFVLSFFDQYGNASHLWSPDSGSIVVAGTVLLTPESPAVNPAEPLSPPRREPEQVWVLDASGAKPPRAIGPGFLAFWSPK